MDAKEALRDLLEAVEPFRTFRKDPDEHVARVANTEFPPGIRSAELAWLELTVRNALRVVS